MGRALDGVKRAIGWPETGSEQEDERDWNEHRHAKPVKVKAEGGERPAGEEQEQNDLGHDCVVGLRWREYQIGREPVIEAASRISINAKTDCGENSGEAMPGVDFHRLPLRVESPVAGAHEAHPQEAERSTSGKKSFEMHSP